MVRQWGGMLHLACAMCWHCTGWVSWNCKIICFDKYWQARGKIPVQSPKSKPKIPKSRISKKGLLLGFWLSLKSYGPPTPPSPYIMEDPSIWFRYQPALSWVPLRVIKVSLVIPGGQREGGGVQLVTIRWHWHYLGTFMSYDPLESWLFTWGMFSFLGSNHASCLVGEWWCLIA